MTIDRSSAADRAAADRSSSGYRRQRGLLACAVAATSIWLAALLLLAVRTANPVTLNRSQLLTSEAVVVARPDLKTVRGDTVTVTVTSVLSGRDVPGSFPLGNATTEQFREGSSYLIPLKSRGRGYSVAPVPTLRMRATPQGPVMQPVEDAENQTAVFYPATDDVLRVAERILVTETARPYP